MAIPCQKLNTTEELEPYSRNLLSIDAQRMLRVLDSTIKKCLFLLSIDKIKELNWENGKVNEDIRRLLCEFSHLRARYSNDRAVTNAEKYSEINDCGSEGNIENPRVMTDSHETVQSTFLTRTIDGNMAPNDQSQRLRQDILLVVRHLLRLIQRSALFDELTEKFLNVTPRSSSRLLELNLPLSVSKFKETCPQAYLPEFLSRPQSRLMRYFLQLRASVFEGMLTTPEDRKRRKKYIKEVSHRLNESQTKLDNLQKELDNIVAKNKTQVRVTAKKVQELRQEITNLENYLAKRRQQIVADESKTSQDLEQKRQNECAELKKKLNETQEAYKKQVAENQLFENNGRRNLFKIEMELETKISKYDQEMSTLKEEYDILDEEYTHEKKELNELEERFRTLEEEYLQIMEERRMEEERVRREEERRKALEHAATTIQAYWRSYKTRKLARGRRGGRGKK